MRMNKRNAKEFREGILDARRGVERPWENSLQKQGPYWEAHKRTVQKGTKLQEPMYLREEKLALELALLDDRICDLLGGDDSLGLLWGDMPEDKRKALTKYLTSWVNDFRDVRDHYGLES